MDIEKIKFLTALTLVVCFLLLPLGSLGLSFFYELGSKLKKKVLLDKLAQQIARQGLIFGLGVGISLAILSFWPGFGVEVNMDLLGSPLWTQGLIFLGASLLLTISYFALWKSLKNIKVLHLLLGIGAIVFYKLFLFNFFRVSYNLLLVSNTNYPPLNSVFYPVVGQLFILSFLFSTSMAFIFLILRRKIDDFGRDYYRYALHVLSKSGILILVLSIIPCLVVFYLLQERFVFAPLIQPGAVIILAMLFHFFVFYWLLKQNQPLRYKGLISLLPLGSMVLLFFRLVSYFELFKMAGH